jgi:rhodanese-related sulfurtransferase
LPTEIDLHEVQRLLRDEAGQLVEVLPEREFEQEHLPGAVNVSLKKLTAETVAGLDESRPVIVYCWDDG